MSFRGGFRDGWKRAAQSSGPPADKGTVGSGTTLPPRPSTGTTSAPSPIPIGFYHNRAEDKLEGQNLFSGERHIILFGLNGAGKSTRLLVELLMTASYRSFVIFDIKGELTFQTAEERRRYGDVKIINPYRLHGLPSDGFNPLAKIEAHDPLLYDKCDAISDALIEISSNEEKYWTESARGLLTALLMWEIICATEEAHIPTLLNVRARLTEPDEHEEYVDSDGSRQKRQIKGLKVTAAKMIASGNWKIKDLVGRFVREHGLDEITSIQSTANTQTQWMLTDYLIEDVKKDGVNFHEMRAKPVSVYIVLPVDEVRRRRHWTRMIIACALSAHLTPAPMTTLFVLDEFRAAVGALDVLKDMWSLVRGYGVQLMPILQSAIQLENLFDKEWENYVGQAGAVVTLGPPNDMFTAEWMSKRCGVTTVVQANFNIGDGVNTGRNSSEQASGGNRDGRNLGLNTSGGLNFSQSERPFMRPQELMDLPLGHGRIWVPGMGTRSIPFFAPNYWRRREPWTARVKPSPYHSARSQS